MRSEGEDDALLSAYLDGVAELTPDERKRVESHLDPAEAAATRTLLGRLRALPAASSSAEPDWTVMERSIRDAVGHEVPRPWWRLSRLSWKWVLPVVACAAAAIVVVMVARPSTREPAPVATQVPHVMPAPVEAPVAPTTAPLVYLDGEALDIDAVDLEALEDPVIADEDSLLPTDHWVDRLDERALVRAEHLFRKKS